MSHVRLTEPPTYFAPGDRISGTRMLVERTFGRGGQGEVHLVVNEISRQKQVIKLLHPELVRSPSALARFEKEVQLMAMLTHPHIVKLLHTDVAAPEGTRPPLPYLLMEHLEGESLADTLMSKTASMRWRTAVRFFAEIAEALAWASTKAGLVHRDLKPANLFVARDADGKAFAKVLDFGISQLCEALTSVTSDDLLGTAHYSAPEQYSGRTSPKTDVYQLGLVVWETFAGCHPYREKTTQQALMYAQLEIVPPALATVVEGCPRALSKLVEGMLDKEPKRRPTMDVVANTLREVVGDAAVSGRTIPCGRRAPWDHEPADEHRVEAAAPNLAPTRRLEPSEALRLTPAPLDGAAAFAATVPATEAAQGTPLLQAPADSMPAPIAATKRSVTIPAHVGTGVLGEPASPPASARTGEVPQERDASELDARGDENDDGHVAEPSEEIAHSAPHEGGIDDGLGDATSDSEEPQPAQPTPPGGRQRYGPIFVVSMITTVLVIMLVAVAIGYAFLTFRPNDRTSQVTASGPANTAIPSASASSSPLTSAEPPSGTTTAHLPPSAPSARETPRAKQTAPQNVSSGRSVGDARPAQASPTARPVPAAPSSSAAGYDHLMQ